MTSTFIINIKYTPKVLMDNLWHYCAVEESPGKRLGRCKHNIAGVLEGLTPALSICSPATMKRIALFCHLLLQSCPALPQILKQCGQIARRIKPQALRGKWIFPHFRLVVSDSSSQWYKAGQQTLKRWKYGAGS